MARRNQIASGAEAGIYILLAVLIFVALWYFATVGKPALAAWLDQKGANFAGGITDGIFNAAQSGGIFGAAATSASGPLNDWLSNFTQGLDEWNQSLNPAGS